MQNCMVSLPEWCSFHAKLHGIINRVYLVIFINENNHLLMNFVYLCSERNRKSVSDQ